MNTTSETSDGPALMAAAAAETARVVAHAAADAARARTRLETAT